MAELQGAKVAISDANTGQVIEYEMVRVGTLAEFRALVEANEEREAFESRTVAELHDTKQKLRQANDTAAAMRAQRDHSAATLAGVGGARDSALASVEEMTRQRDEAKALLAEMTRQRDTGLATVGDLQEALEKETKKCEETQGAAEIDEAAAMGRQDRIADLLAQLDEAKTALQTNVEQIIGAFGDLG